MRAVPWGERAGMCSLAVSEGSAASNSATGAPVDGASLAAGEGQGQPPSDGPGFGLDQASSVAARRTRSKASLISVSFSAA